MSRRRDGRDLEGMASAARFGVRGVRCGRHGVVAARRRDREDRERDRRRGERGDPARAPQRTPRTSGRPLSGTGRDARRSSMKIASQEAFSP